MKPAAVLVVEDIPVFMTDLSNTAVQSNTVITQSADTVQTIVDILNTIASISQTITISQPVMEDFLKTVDIIVSDASKNTWTELNNGNKTENKSTELLQAIETISDRVSNVNDYMINKTSIQLHRKTITNSFTETSSLQNSTTQIVIPNVLKPTLITIIIFTKLDNVLPTRNTSNNDNKTSENHINGDVIVVRVNKAINNISFIFNTTNTSLTNPQCVFWNFDLDHWDSTGCKVKHSENNMVTCECNHTTSFSVLMSPFAIDNPALAYITYIGVAISLASLLLCLIIETIVWKSATRNDTSYMRHVSIVNIAVSLLIADTCFIIGAAIADQEQPISVGRCSPVVFFMHFFYLAVFFWMFISALLLLNRTVIVLFQLSRAKMMAIAFTFGYCAPLLIAAITVASTAGPQHYVTKENACWLNWYESKALLAFVIPALTIVGFNLLVLIVVVIRMRRIGAHEKHTLVVIVQCVAILTPIFGLTWGFGIGTMVSREFGIHMIFAIFNSLQGFFVLVFGTLSDRKVRESLPTKLLLQNLISNHTRV
ncbi:adhesion G-protein coupled receptor F1-like [Misgurnus anguillicaudatus]|uniref:adhesion G-protein coupled receptor F1-like n=1 Tax=Misgurnus anguillicaudatus TaxID=75329 RepID=UPI003CCF9257